MVYAPLDRAMLLIDGLLLLVIKLRLPLADFCRGVGSIRESFFIIYALFRFKGCIGGILATI